MKITANDVVLRNLRIEGDSAADYSLSVGDFSNDVLGFRMSGCLIRGGSGAGVLVKLHGCGDAYFVGNELAWGGIGYDMAGNSTGFPTQIFILGNIFHNLSVAHVRGHSVTGKVLNLNLIGNKHDVSEDNGEPTEWISLNHSGSNGTIEDCTFARATNASSTFVIPTHVHWIANKTEAGVSSARPA